MTKPLHVSRAQAEKYKRNLTGPATAKPKRKTTKPRRVTLHVADDVKPETLAALVSLAMRVMEMGEDELTTFIKRVRTS
jgi:hypothetical protein